MTTRDPEPGRRDADEPLQAFRRLFVLDVPNVLLEPAPWLVETVRFSQVGHLFFHFPHGIASDPAVPPYIVQDFLVSQGFGGADGKMAPRTTFDLTTATQYRFTVRPAVDSRRVRVAPPAGLPTWEWPGVGAGTHVYLSFNVGRQAVEPLPDAYDFHGGRLEFLGLAGVPPASTCELTIGRESNRWLELSAFVPVPQPFSFSAFRAIGSYPRRSFDSGEREYAPLSSTWPYGLTAVPASSAAPHLMFTYRTFESTDPGPFVFLE